MKIIILLLLLILGGTSSSWAQHIRVGAKAGINISQLTGKDAEPLTNRTGFHAGLTAQLDLSDKVGLRPELIYSTQGGNDPDGDKFYLDYLNLPILLEYELIKSLRLQAGPQFGIKVHESDSFIEVRNFDCSAVFGIQYGIGKFFGQARYNLGFIKLYETTDAKNGVFQISIGYYFH